MVGAQRSRQRRRARRAALAQARDGRRGLRRERGPALDRRGAKLGEERSVVFGRLVTVGGRLRARQATLALEVARDAAGELLDQLGDVGIGERRGRLEARRASAARRDEGAVEHQRVEVQVEIESVAKALREEHGAGAGGERGLTARGGLAFARTRARKSLGGASECALLQPTEQRARDDAAHGGAQSRAGGEQEGGGRGSGDAIR